jgi:small conductance mechanosensitive channel
MNNLNVDAMKQFVYTSVAGLGMKILGAFILWIIGRWLIGLAKSMIGKGLTRQHIDPTLVRWVQNATSALLNIALVVAILGYFGVQTTTFAALIAAAGVAIGMAWSGLLSKFRRRSLSGHPAAIQGRRLRHSRRRDGNGGGGGIVRYHGQYAG